MKKLILFLSVVVALGVMTSCSQDGDTVIDPPGLVNASQKTVSNIETKVVSKADALDIAAMFNANRFNPAASRSAQVVETIANKMGQPIAYVVNNDEGGWVIVSATTDYHPILAYSDDETGRFDVSSGLTNTGLSIWVDEIAADIEASASLDEMTSAQIASEWYAFAHAAETMASGVPTGNSAEAVKCRTRLKELNDQYYNDGWTFTTLSNVTDVTLPNDVYSTADNVGSPYEYTIVGIRNVSENSQIGPLLTTTWSQTYSSYYPAGCVPIAMGQIMNYHKYPSKFNWSGMKDHESTSATCDLIDDIRSVLGMTGNEANYYDALQGFLTYGYKASLIEHNNTDVINELNYKL